MNVPSRCLLILLLVLIGRVAAAQQTTADTTIKYYIESNIGSFDPAVAVSHDTTTDLDTIWLPGSQSPQLRPRVIAHGDQQQPRKILSVSDPIRPPREISWSTPHDARPPLSLNPLPQQNICDCDGHARTNGWQMFEAKVGLALKGSNSYTQVTQGAVVQQNSIFFGPGNAGGEQLDLEGQLAGGYRWQRWDLGLDIEIVPSDSFIYFPFSAHARYYFADDCCALSAFLNAGLPMDFGQVGGPLILAPIYDKRQRAFLSLGVGKTWPFNSFVMAADLGFRYMNVPLAQLQCCPDIPAADRFPTRESRAMFAQIGVAF